MLSDKTLAGLRALNAIAEKRGQTLAQMAIAWVLRGGRVTSALIGASKSQQIIDCVAALEKSDFTKAELAEIDKYALEANVNLWAASAERAGPPRKRNRNHRQNQLIGPKFGAFRLCGGLVSSILKFLVGDAFRHFRRPDAEGWQIIDAERCDHCHIRCVSAADHNDAADTGDIVARIDRVPLPVQKHFEPGAEIIKPGIGHADVTKISADITGWNVHCPAKADAQMGKVSADAGFFG